MNRSFHLLASLLLAAPLFAPTAFATDPGAERILGCMRNNVPKAQRIHRFELRDFDSEGLARTYQGRMTARFGAPGAGDETGWAAVVHMLQPADVAGSAYLYAAQRDETPHAYVYLSGLRRVRHLSGGADLTGSFLGSNFTFRELRQLAGGFEGSSVRVESRDTFAGRPVWVLSVAANATEPGESTMVWVDEQTCVPLRADFIDGGKVAKRYRASADALHRDGRYWFASEMEMSDAGTGSRSVLRFEGVDSEARLSSVDFNPTQFYQRN